MNKLLIVREKNDWLHIETVSDNGSECHCHRLGHKHRCGFSHLSFDVDGLHRLDLGVDDEQT
jgi:hypothetical protein